VYVCRLYIIHHVSFLCVYILKKTLKKINFFFKFFSSTISSPLSRLLFSLKKKLNGASVTWCAPRSIFHGVDVTLRRASKNGLSPPKFPRTFQHGSNLLLQLKFPTFLFVFLDFSSNISSEISSAQHKKSSQFSSL
jgi:hypothetical protein